MHHHTIFFGLVPHEGLVITHDIVMLHEQNEVQKPLFKGQLCLSSWNNQEVSFVNLAWEAIVCAQGCQFKFHGSEVDQLREQRQGGLHCDQQLCKEKKLDKNQTQNKRTRQGTSEKEFGGKAPTHLI